MTLPPKRKANKKGHYCILCNLPKSPDVAGDGGRPITSQAGASSPYGTDGNDSVLMTAINPWYSRKITWLRMKLKLTPADVGVDAACAQDKSKLRERVDEIRVENPTGKVAKAYIRWLEIRHSRGHEGCNTFRTVNLGLAIKPNTLNITARLIRYKDIPTCKKTREIVTLECTRHKENYKLNLRSTVKS
ncbi:hypothetical protein V1477_002641 [Vespula maculifrons]|uniref:Uncharacterized protein n=1 Tax=Vespula maculifrons TaxID=7453 RepID=A0ABD2CV96_VESMC